jgi:hypothetical protein
MSCKLCNDTGEQRYWEARWRDEKAEIERLRAALRDLVDRWATERGYDGAIQRARALLLEGDLRSPKSEDVRRALNEQAEK